MPALIDWCQITVKDVSLGEVIEQVLRIPSELMEVTDYQKGIAGHELVAVFDNIKVLKPTGKAWKRPRHQLEQINSGSAKKGGQTGTGTIKRQERGTNSYVHIK